MLGSGDDVAANTRLPEGGGKCCGKADGLKIGVDAQGKVIQPGSELVKIVPLDDTLLVEARIRPQDIGFLNPGQAAMVKFTAYDHIIYGGLPAKLEQIGADTITDEEGNSFYLIKLRTDKSYLGSREAPMLIIPGMVASVDVITGHKSVLSYLLKPILHARIEAQRGYGIGLRGVIVAPRLGFSPPGSGLFSCCQGAKRCHRA